MSDGFEERFLVTSPTRVVRRLFSGCMAVLGAHESQDLLHGRWVRLMLNPTPVALKYDTFAPEWEAQ